MTSLGFQRFDMLDLPGDDPHPIRGLSSEAQAFLTLLSPISYVDFNVLRAEREIERDELYFKSHPAIGDGAIWERHIARQYQTSEKEIIELKHRYSELKIDPGGLIGPKHTHARAQAWAKLRLLRTPLESLHLSEQRVMCELRNEDKRAIPPPRPLPSRQSPDGLNLSGARQAEAAMIDVSKLRSDAARKAYEEEVARKTREGEAAAHPRGMLDQLLNRQQTRDPVMLDPSQVRAAANKQAYERECEAALRLVATLNEPATSSDAAFVPATPNAAERTASAPLSDNVLRFPMGNRVPPTQIDDGDPLDFDPPDVSPLDSPATGDRMIEARPQPAPRKRVVIRDLLSRGDLRVYEIQEASGLSFKNKKALQIEVERKKGVGLSSANKDSRWSEAIEKAIKRCANLQRALIAADHLFPEGFTIPFDAVAKSSVRDKLVSSKLPKGAIDLFLLRLRIFLNREVD
jgi:hypothetical protein